MKCPNCKKEVPSGAKVCGYCGKPLEVKKTIKTCPGCGTEVPKTAKICGECGTPIDQKKSAAAKITPAKEKLKPSPVNVPAPTAARSTEGAYKWMLPVVIVILAIMAAGLAWNFILKPSSNATNGQMVAELGGRWIGYDDTWHIIIIFEIDDSCQIGDYCGTFNIPDIPLTGDVFFLEIDGKRYYYMTANLSNGEPTGAEYEYLELLPDGKVRYFATGPWGTNDIILTKSD